MKKIIKRMTALVFIIMFLISIAVPVLAAFNINDAAGSVVRVLAYDPTFGFGTGSAFVIAQDGGSTYLVTNRHVITDWIVWRDANGNVVDVDIFDSRNNTSIVLDDAFDIRLPASVILLSEDLNDGMDLAILRVDTGLSNRRVLPLAPVETAQRGDSIYMLGFPGLVDNFFGGDTVLPSTEEHVTISPGHITNLNIESDGTKYLQHSAPTAGGASGGPIITESGAVIGVHAFTMTAAEGYKGAVHIDYIIEQCIRLNIPYVPAGSAQDGGSFFADYWWILAIAAVATLAIVFYISSSKKKTAPATSAASASPSAPAPHAAPAQYAAPAAAARQATLMCSKGHLAGSSFPIRGVIAIGRDPARCQVVYPADTKGISSLHCEVMEQSGSITLIDKGSTYGTFLAGGQKLAANQSVTLAAGAIFYLADPKNEFRIL
jgi:hypothetical protein